MVIDIDCQHHSSQRERPESVGSPDRKKKKKSKIRYKATPLHDAGEGGVRGTRQDKKGREKGKRSSESSLIDVVRLVVIQTMVSRVNREVRLVVSRGGGVVVVVVRQVRGRRYGRRPF